MLLTIHLPWTHFSPAVIASHLEESIIMGTDAISGSDAMRLRKLTISFWASRSPSSIFMSMTRAPSSTCFRAMERASSYWPLLISRRNLREPATLQRSPTFTNCTSGVTSRSSNPLSHIVVDGEFGICGFFPSVNAG